MVGPVSHISKTARRGALGSREFDDCLFVDRQLLVICHRSRRTQPQSLPGQCALRAVKSQWRGRNAFRRVLASTLLQFGAEGLSLRARSSNGWSIGFLIGRGYAASYIFQLLTLEFMGLSPLLGPQREFCSR
jgi:hypothetical protein